MIHMMISILLMRKLNPRESKDHKQTHVTIKQEKNHTTLLSDIADDFPLYPRKPLAVLGHEARSKITYIEPHHFIFEFFSLIVYLFLKIFNEVKFT